MTTDSFFDVDLALGVFRSSRTPHEKPRFLPTRSALRNALQEAAEDILNRAAKVSAHMPSDKAAYQTLALGASEAAQYMRYAKEVVSHKNQSTYETICAHIVAASALTKLPPQEAARHVLEHEIAFRVMPHLSRVTRERFALPDLPALPIQPII